MAEEGMEDVRSSLGPSGEAYNSNVALLVPIFDAERPIRSTADKGAWYTSKPTESAKKSHINQCLLDSLGKPRQLWSSSRHPDVVA